MNWVDIVCISIVGFSALLAVMRGFVREVLGIGSWIAAGFFAVWALPFARGRFHEWIGNVEYAELAAFAAMFLVALIVLSVVAGMIGGVVRGSQLGGIDRTLGVVFGVLRGALLIAFAYIAAGIIIEPDAWPQPVLKSRTLPYAYRGALLAVSLLPSDYRPIVRVPPEEVVVKSEDLLHAKPEGSAVNRPAPGPGVPPK